MIIDNNFQKQKLNKSKLFYVFLELISISDNEKIKKQKTCLGLRKQIKETKKNILRNTKNNNFFEFLKIIVRRVYKK